MSEGRPNSSHWGSFRARMDEDGVLQVRADPRDPAPSPLLENIPTAVDPAHRILRPAVRTGWLERGPGPDRRRGRDSYTQVSWSELEELLSDELRRVYDEHGPSAVFGGSYGWSSAGRFHHAQSQVHRFLNALGGYVRSRHTYSHGASSVVLPYLVGPDLEVVRGLTDWPTVVEHTELLLAFGGIPRKNLGVASGGITQHRVAGHLDELAARGTRVVSVSPLRDDADAGGHVEWWPLRPGSDVALMLALLHVLFVEDLADRDFLERHCIGGDVVEAYVLGQHDGVVNSPEWASAECEVSPESIRALARDLVSRRSLVTVTWSLQRARFGEQAPWAGLALAAAIGQLGLPGGGFGHGYGSMGDVGTRGGERRLPTLPQGSNGIDVAIPVARIADMLLDPGGRYEYDGGAHSYPDIRLVYWAGGNPFHHHQDLHRLRSAFARVETLVVHEPFWTPMAWHADIVVPATTSLERNDIAAAHSDRFVSPMHRVVPPVGEARDDYAVFAALASRLGVGERFTEGRDADAWIRHLYEDWTRVQPEDDWPPFDSWWECGLELPGLPEERVLLQDFRRDPDAHPLRTPSGRIELHSERIAAFGYDDCPGYPVWRAPDEYLGSSRAEQWPLLLIANQPSRRLHSQLDAGAHSRAGKILGREVLRVHPDDAAARGIADGDIVRVHNDRGACLAGARLSRDLRPGVVHLPTGAWFDPVEDPAGGQPLCSAGSVNVLTADVGTSRLAQGTTGQHVLVELERYDHPLPPLRGHRPPPFVERER